MIRIQMFRMIPEYAWDHLRRDGAERVPVETYLRCACVKCWEDLAPGTAREGAGVKWCIGKASEEWHRRYGKF